MRTLERVATHGGRLCAALREAVLEERARSTDGPSPRHAALRALGYTGLSELLSVHVDGPDPEPSVAARSGST